MSQEQIIKHFTSRFTVIVSLIESHNSLYIIKRLNVSTKRLNKQIVDIINNKFEIKITEFNSDYFVYKKNLSQEKRWKIFSNKICMYPY